ncbi:hypothetical protein DAI22_02g318950 [Oryza sativa Japonica Group]|nr:hypothetical protein DAI22_02g318950 [Oryza sativa Japonica Group]
MRCFGPPELCSIGMVHPCSLATEVQPCGHRCSDASEFRAGRTSQSAREPASDSGSNSGFGIGSDPSGISSDGEIRLCLESCGRYKTKHTGKVLQLSLPLSYRARLAAQFKVGIALR